MTLPQPPLGANEFCTHLNGSDAEIAFRTLRKFTNTLHFEYAKAHNHRLPTTDHRVDQMWSQLTTSVKSSPKKKVYKWMEDRASYNVPFVGTSVARGSVGTLIEGEWPSGLLKAYLDVSPNASEFSFSNLQYLCKLCASKEHAVGMKVAVVAALCALARCEESREKLGEYTAFVQEIVRDKGVHLLLFEYVLKLIGVCAVQWPQNPVLVVELEYGVVSSWWKASKSKSDDKDNSIKVVNDKAVVALHLAIKLLHAADKSGRKRYYHGMFYETLRAVLRLGLKKQPHPPYMTTLDSFLHAVRNLAFGGLLQQRELNELFSHESLDRLSRFSKRAPAASLEFILNCKDNFDDDTPVCTVPARRILYHILINTSFGSSAQMAKILLQSIAPTQMALAIEGTVQCCTKRKGMQDALFAIMSFPISVTDTVESLAELLYLRGILQRLPPSRPKVLLPASLTKSLLTKALQLQNGFVVHQTLLLLRVIFTHVGKIDAFKALQRCMPDVQALLALRGKHSVALQRLVLLVINDYILQIPSSVREVKFDWYKWISGTNDCDEEDILVTAFDVITNIYFRPSSDLDLKSDTLTTLTSFDSVKHLPSLLSILTTTISTLIYDKCRTFIIHVLRRTFYCTEIESSSNTSSLSYEHHQCVSRECDLWLDYIKSEDIASWMKWYRTAHRRGMELLLAAARGGRERTYATPLFYAAMEDIKGKSNCDLNSTEAKLVRNVCDGMEQYQFGLASKKEDTNYQCHKRKVVGGIENDDIRLRRILHRLGSVGEEGADVVKIEMALDCILRHNEASTYNLQHIIRIHSTFNGRYPVHAMGLSILLDNYESSVGDEELKACENSLQLIRIACLPLRTLPLYLLSQNDIDSKKWKRLCRLQYFTYRFPYFNTNHPILLIQALFHDWKYQLEHTQGNSNIKNNDMELDSSVILQALHMDAYGEILCLLLDNNNELINGNCISILQWLILKRHYKILRGFLVRNSMMYGPKIIRLLISEQQQRIDLDLSLLQMLLWDCRYYSSQDRALLLHYIVANCKLMNRVCMAATKEDKAITAVGTTTFDILYKLSFHDEKCQPLRRVLESVISYENMDLKKVHFPILNKQIKLGLIKNWNVSMITALLQYGMKTVEVDGGEKFFSCSDALRCVNTLLSKNPITKNDDDDDDKIIAKQQALEFIVLHPSLETILSSSKYTNEGEALSQLLLCLSTSVISYFGNTQRNISLVSSECILRSYRGSTSLKDQNLYQVLSHGNLVLSDECDTSLLCDEGWISSLLSLNRVKATIISNVNDTNVNTNEVYDLHAIVPILYSAFYRSHSNFIHKKDDGKNSPQTFAFAMGLIQKGGLALILHTLSSNMSSLRRLAVGTLALIRRMFRCISDSSSESRFVAQLSMLIDSVQRGYIYKRRKFVTVSTSSPSEYMTPVLSCYASTFLSRASLILLKPLHVLYPSLNAYFLKSSSSLLIHNESSNKLPAFMSFFYSLDVTKDEGDANASERMFALELLLCVNDIRCYKLCCNGHVPELLLSSFVDGLHTLSSSSPFHFETLSLLLKVLQRWLKDLEHARVHLLDHLGLIAWCRSVWPLLLSPSLCQTNRKDFQSNISNVMKEFRALACIAISYVSDKAMVQSAMELLVFIVNGDDSVCSCLSLYLEAVRSLYEFCRSSSYVCCCLNRYSVSVRHLLMHVNEDFHDDNSINVLRVMALLPLEPERDASVCISVMKLVSRQHFLFSSSITNIGYEAGVYCGSADNSWAVNILECILLWLLNSMKSYRDELLEKEEFWNSLLVMMVKCNHVISHAEVSSQLREFCLNLCSFESNANCKLFSSTLHRYLLSQK